eukprot:gene6504-4686_t
MQTEDPRVYDSPCAEQLAAVTGAHPRTRSLSSCAAADPTTADGFAARWRWYNAQNEEALEVLGDLWGDASPPVEAAEENSSFLQRYFYGWVKPVTVAASKEQLVVEILPPPTQDSTARSAGWCLWQSMSSALFRRNAWSALLGCEVTSRLDRESRGTLRWVGVPQQGKFDRMMAGVEWRVPPRVREAERSGGASTDPFFDGVAYGEHLFEPATRSMSTLEEAKSLELLAAPPQSELGRIIGKPSRMSLTKCLLQALPKLFWRQIPYKLLGDLCTLTIPMVLQRYVKLINAATPTWGTGLVCVALLFVLQMIQSCSLHRFYYISIKGGLQYRSALVASIFHKCLTISSKSLALPEMNVGRIVNMMGGDVERVNDMMQFCMYLWSSPLVFCISIAQLYRLVGPASLMAVIAMGISMPINAKLMKIQMDARKELIKATDERVKATNEFLSGIRISKLMAWELRFISNIDAKREREIHFLRKVQLTRVATYFLNVSTPMVMIATVFVLYFLLGHELVPSIVFPTIALLGIIRMPFMMLPFVFSMAVQFIVSINRLRAFFECDNTALCTDAELSAFVPVKLPLLPPLKTSWLVNLSNYLCLCCPSDWRARPKRPPLVYNADGAAVSPSSPTTPTPSALTRPFPKTDKMKEAYELERKVLLHDVNVEIPRGRLTVVIGPTGCGKSTLVQSLLSQLEVSKGRVWATKSIAYVPQQPWIMNATVRENVLFFSEERDEPLREALRVSQLETDLGLMANGLETEIGEKGINLSGGQKARVSLARAVYADREMYLLDDPLSALDAHVGEKVVRECILGKLAGRTRVLATHHMHVLKHADHVIALGEHRVVFSGSRESFMETETYRQMLVEEEEEDQRDEEVPEPKDAGEAATEAKEEKADAAAGHLMTEEEKAVGSVPMATYFKYFKYCGGMAVVALILSLYAITEFLLQSGGLWLSMWSTNRFDLPGTTNLLIYIGCVSAATISAPLRYWNMFTALRRGAVNLHRDLLRSIAAGTMEFFDTTPLGRIMNRFSRDIDLADNGLPMSAVNMLNSGFGILSSLIITMTSQPIVLLAILPCALLYYRIMIFYNAANREIRRLTSVMKSPVFALLSEVLNGAATITAYDVSRDVMQVTLRRLDIVFSCGNLENVSNRWLGVRIEFLSNVVVTSSALTGVIVVMTHALKADITLISLAVTMAIQTTSQLNWLVRQLASVEADMNSIERLIHYTSEIAHEDMPELSSEVEAYKLEQTQDATVSVTVVPVKPHVIVAGSLEFRNVQMRYREGLPLVLRDVTFCIAPREKVGVVGRTGSGKSTLMLTFMRMVDICGGEILVNGSGIRTYPLRELRKQFSMIPQDPVLFDGTVRQNLDPFQESSAEEVWEALTLCGLRERVESETGGLDGRVLEGGSNFSVGQRQLLCMARALLRKGSGFILMDEATANIDPTLDRYIQSTVMNAFAEYTVITIAHRLHTVANYDKIIVMDQGVVAETGTPRELVSNRQSIFRGMVDSMGAEALAEVPLLSLSIYIFIYRLPHCGILWSCSMQDGSVSTPVLPHLLYEFFFSLFFFFVVVVVLFFPPVCVLLLLLLFYAMLARCDLGSRCDLGTLPEEPPQVPEERLTITITWVSVPQQSERDVDLAGATHKYCYGLLCEEKMEFYIERKANAAPAQFTAVKASLGCQRHLHLAIENLLNATTAPASAPVRQRGSRSEHLMRRVFFYSATGSRALVVRRQGREVGSAVASLSAPTARRFGEAPSRVRPVEVPREHAWRQSEREVSASLLIAFMLIVPLWLIIASNAERSREQAAALRHSGCRALLLFDGMGLPPPSSLAATKRLKAFITALKLPASHTDSSPRLFVSPLDFLFFFFSLFVCWFLCQKNTRPYRNLSPFNAVITTPPATSAACEALVATQRSDVRPYSRGIPYTPVGTIQDFTSSPRHIGIERLFQEKDESMNRGAGGNYAGPIITTPQGARPLLGARQPPPPQGMMHQFYAETAAMSGDSYRQDCRTDPQYAHLPDHVRSAQQSILDMQHDSFGESIRGMVPPPPRVSPDEAPQAYTAPQAAVPKGWYTVVAGFLVVFAGMGTMTDTKSDASRFNFPVTDADADGLAALLTRLPSSLSLSLSLSSFTTFSLFVCGNCSWNPSIASIQHLHPCR